MTQRAPRSGHASPAGAAAGGGEGAGLGGAPRRPEAVEADGGGVEGDAVGGAGSAAPRRRRSTKVKPDSGSDPTTDPFLPWEAASQLYRLSTDRSTEPETQQGAGSSR